MQFNIHWSPAIGYTGILTSTAFHLLPLFKKILIYHIYYGTINLSWIFQKAKEQINKLSKENAVLSSQNVELELQVKILQDHKNTDNW